MGRVVVQEAPRLEEAVVSRVTVEEAVGVQQVKQVVSVDPRHARVTGEDVATFRQHCSPQSPLSLMDLMTLGK